MKNCYALSYLSGIMRTFLVFNDLITNLTKKNFIVYRNCWMTECDLQHLGCRNQ